MKQLFFALCVLVAGAAFGQGLPIQANIHGYRGNPVVSDTIRFSPADTASLAVTARPAVGSGLTNPQPTIVRKGLAGVVRFGASQTLPELSRYEITGLNGAIRFYGDVTVNKQGIVFPVPGGSILSGIYSQLGVLQGLINNLSAGTVSLSSYASFTAATGTTLAQHTADIANRVLSSDYNTYKTNTALSISNINSALSLKLSIADTVGFQRRLAGYGLYPNADKIKLAGIAVGATNVDSTLLLRKSTFALEKAVLNAAIAVNAADIASIKPRFFTSLANALAARATAPATPQQWIVQTDETYLVGGLPGWQSYEWDGKELYYGAKQKADGSPGTPVFNTLASRVSALEAVPLSTTSVFANQIPFTSYYNDLGTISFSQNRLTSSGMATYVTSSTLTPNTASAKPGTTSLVRVVANGTTPTLSAFKLTTGSQNFVPTSGTINILGFFYDGLSYWLTMFQETGATPLDIIAPTLVSASIADNNRTQLVLTYNEALDTGAGLAASDFTILGKTISSLAVSGSAITATVSAPFVYNDVVNISGGSGKIRDASLNIAGNLSNQAVVNTITNLILASASVADAARNQVVFMYNKTVDNTSLPAVSAYSFSPTKAVSSVSSSGNSVTVTVGSPFALGDVITTTYTKPASSFLKDLYGSFWATGTYGVTNNIVTPVLTSATINRGSNSRIAVLANKAITLGSTTASDLSVPGSTISGISVSGSTLNIDVSTPFTGASTPTVSYTSGPGKLQDQYGSLFASVTSLSVTNNVQMWVPVTWSTTSLSVASGIWSPTTNVGTTSFGQTGVTTTKLASGNDGGIRQLHNTTDSYFSAIGLKTASTLGGYQTFTYGAYVSSGGTLSRIDNGTVTTVGGGLIASNERLMINRIGTVVKIQKLGTDGVTVTDIYTFAASSSTDLYGAVDVRGDGKNNTPQSDNLK